MKKYFKTLWNNNNNSKRKKTMASNAYIKIKKDLKQPKFTLQRT